MARGFEQAPDLSIPALAQTHLVPRHALRNCPRIRCDRTWPDHLRAGFPASISPAAPDRGFRGPAPGSAAPHRTMGASAGAPSSPSLVKSSSPEVFTSSRPTTTQRPTRRRRQVFEHRRATLGVAAGGHLADGLVIKEYGGATALLLRSAAGGGQDLAIQLEPVRRLRPVAQLCDLAIHLQAAGGQPFLDAAPRAQPRGGQQFLDALGHARWSADG